ncbi:MAG: aminotransferase class III-fold pyridoxal phosphate-dependent enzyme, partial [Caldilineaceae bacterium]|nr:aminotransferase class III-fold pyridoxal phosphate-dependent enzyme [Caldilineaceae bacterium]
TFFTLNQPIIELAEQIVEAAPCGEKIRFVTTGSDAVSFAIRMARALTGRSKILRFEGGWHGVSDGLLFGARPPAPSDYPHATPDSAGLPSAYGNDVLVSPFNAAGEAAELIEAHADELAAVVVEPLQRCILPRPGFFETLREETTKHGVILIFDEVVTGFRMAWGGAQERYGVVPDLATYGKTISGGYPSAAICGRADLLETANPRRAPYPADPQAIIASGTFNGNPLSAAAGLATLNELAKPGTYERLFAMGDRITREITAMGQECSIPLLVGGEGPVLQILFTTDETIRNYESMLYADRAKAYTFGVEMIRRGCFVSPFEKIYLSLAHSDADIDRFLEAARDVLRHVIG